MYQDSQENYNSKRIVIREIGNDKVKPGLCASAAAFANEGTTVNDGVDLANPGLDNLSAANTASNSTVDWVDEKDPPIKVGYDAINQRLEFTVDNGARFGDRQ